jgi:hypothetical protein
VGLAPGGLTGPAPGLAFYAAWNLLVVAIMALVARRFPVRAGPEAGGRSAEA